MAKLKVGVIGARSIGAKHGGEPQSPNIGYYHAGNIQKSNLGEVVAISRTYKEGALRTAKIFNSAFNAECKGYDDPIKMLDHKKLDLVYICTPPEYHLQLVEEALARGIHVVCEKPLAYPDLSKKDEILKHAESLVNLAGKEGLYFFVVKQYATLLGDINSILKTENGKQEIKNVSMFIESKGDKKRGDIIADLYPHSIIKHLVKRNGAMTNPTVVMDNDFAILTFEYGDCECEIMLSQSSPTEKRDLPHIKVNDFKFELHREETEEYNLSLRYKTNVNGQKKEVSVLVGDPLRNLDEMMLRHISSSKKRKSIVSAKHGLRDLEDMFTLVEATKIN